MRNLVVTILLLALLGCEKKTESNMGRWLGESESSYTQVVPSVDIEFPQDHKAHSSFRHEWWYLTANLTDQDGEPLGMQWTQFRVAIDPETQTPAQSWHSQQLYMAHSAVTTSKIHYADEKWSRAHPKLAGVETSPFRVFLDDWQWKSQTSDMFPATLEAQSETFGYSLKLESSAPYQKQGKDGYSEKSADGAVASYYYSQPFIEVSGEVTIDGKIHSVAGKGWIDREWSSQFLLDSQQGWDWFALRLDEDLSLVLFQLRDSQTGKASYSHGRIMQRDGLGIPLDPDQITLSPIQYTDIEASSYPTAWQISVPKYDINLEVSAINPSAKMPLTVPYWEGPVSISGSHQGEGYMELTGY
ncbi:attH component of attEFGH ABC transport system [Vibrio ishigakensis]|uniref:AttH component of attEFGH ABC transport system n=1 Tax=Vibrio ishigakensis TaxID=1481914 RepID=A0A0B8NTQ7_9VIBR|nr:lipocalin-like domain-containing protein [Vibrio ishigakensis]GAM54129.1 attH component of attEFGH ABC transport system [Vibrio ishigakensis]